MQKINFQDLPSTTTPLSANNLNQLQTNVENAINGVIESGSNANGSYVKYSDGTLIQYNNATVNDQAISNQYGNTGLYTGTRTITFPISFLDTNYSAFCGEFKWGTGASWGMVNSRNNKNWMTLIALDFISRDAGTNTDVSWIAIGKWK